MPRLNPSEMVRAGMHAAGSRVPHRMQEWSTARLRELRDEIRDIQRQNKQETPGSGIPEVSTHAPPVAAGSEGRCAQSGTT